LQKLQTSRLRRTLSFREIGSIDNVKHRSEDHTFITPTSSAPTDIMEPESDYSLGYTHGVEQARPIIDLEHRLTKQKKHSKWGSGFSGSPLSSWRSQLWGTYL